jgi:Nucleotidyl transferase AbiEii toxin, Type IV TA system
MAELTKNEPQSATDYDDRTTAAVKSVLIDIGQILGSFQGKFAVVGGAVPWLLLENEDMPHVGTVDVDLGLRADALGDGEYATLIAAMMVAGYQQRKELRRFQLARTVPANDDGPPIEVIVDFLMPRNAVVVKNDPPLLTEFAVQKADGVDLALRFYQMVAVKGPMPEGGRNKVEIAVASIPALLAMKGFALRGRQKRKDAYDVYYCVRNYPGGPEALAEACRPLLETEEGTLGFKIIAEKFAAFDAMGPTFVRQFVEESQILADRSPEQWQQDAFGQIDVWLKALDFRP